MICKIFQRRMGSINSPHKDTEMKYTMKFLNYHYLKVDVRILRQQPKQRDVGYKLIMEIIYNTWTWSKIPREDKGGKEINS